MKRVNQYQFYLLGTAIHPLTEFKDTATLSDVWIQLMTAQSWLQFLLADQLTPLVTCRTAAQTLLDFVTGSIPKLDDDVPPEDRQQAWAELLSKPLGWFERHNITLTAQTFETVFAAELETTATYYVSEKGIYATNRLIESADRAFSADVRGQMPPQTLRDVKEAGRCLALDSDTASGFHMVRATETMIHQYYVNVTGATPRRKDRNWGAYVRNLNRHKRLDPQSKVDLKLVVLIDQVREHHRNPVMHPEVALTADEAQSLFMICQAVIITFAGALKDLVTPQQLALVATNP